jgi:hypothetical protein
VRTHGASRAMAVAVGDAPLDPAVLTRAAEVAERERRPLVLAYAAGHLPPEMTYAERHAARADRHARGEQLLADAAEFLHRLVPSVEVTTMVRLLDRDALVPAMAGEASLIITGSVARHRDDREELHPVAAAVRDLESDAYVVEFATDYAARRGLGLAILGGTGEDMSRAAVERSRDTSLLVLPRPQPERAAGYSWPAALDIARRSDSPVVFVSRPSRASV